MEEYVENIRPPYIFSDALDGSYINMNPVDSTLYQKT